MDGVRLVVVERWLKIDAERSAAERSDVDDLFMSYRTRCGTRDVLSVFY